MESVNFPPPPSLIGTSEKQNLNKFYDYHGDRGSGGNQKRPYEMVDPRIMKEIVFLAIPRGNLTDTPIILEATIRGFKVRRIYIDEGSSSEIMYAHCFKSFDAHTKSKLRESNAPLVGFSGEIYHPLGLVGGHGGTRKKQNTHVGIFYSKMPLPLQRHPRKDGDEKS
ncbi:hypothetical protein Tco_1395927 [Tanacetum coccineum]